MLRMDTIETLKDWTLELGGQEYCAASLSIIPWPILRNLAQEKVKLLRSQEIAGCAEIAHLAARARRCEARPK